MLEDVLDATQAVAGWGTWVVSPDEVALEIAARRGGRSATIARRSNAIRSGFLAKRRADALAIVRGSAARDADALQDALRTLGAVVLSRSADGQGTSFLLRRPPRAIPARFGPDSFRRHMDVATLRGLPVAVVERPELAFDLDRPGDILTLLSDGRRGRTREVCQQMDLPSAPNTA
jgi:2-phospho-L-lactate guanylyltransferase (CobY/MobA/RfbA family)